MGNLQEDHVQSNCSLAKPALFDALGIFTPASSYSLKSCGVWFILVDGEAQDL